MDFVEFFNSEELKRIKKHSRMDGSAIQSIESIPLSVFFCMVPVSVVVCLSVLGCVCALELELQLVSDQGDELRVRGLALGVGYGVPEEPLQGV